MENSKPPDDVHAPAIIEELVTRFQRNREAYESAEYNETRLRREFIDPFFEALGWDVANKRGYAEPYKDVVHEDAVKIGETFNAPDYSFRIGPMRKFFVETKRPHVKIATDSAAAFQLRRYAWSAKLSLSVLTDFAELAVYDTRIQPDVNDKASTARVLFVTFDEYTERWSEIAALFSKQAVLEGAFDRYAQSSKLKKGTAEVDDSFLHDVELWREHLARSFAQRNPKLHYRELNYAVQQTLDRIVFLRICEDRGIEPYGRLRALLEGGNVYQRLGELFHAADDRYNSGLFHFREEKDRATPPDLLTLDLQLDDKPLKEMLGGLYYPQSPYEFSVLSPDILGQVYEQFLGKVIRLTTGHRAVVEEKPELKKAGGIYYTPVYIVNYIVRQVLQPMLNDRTPEQVSRLRILDPACGSGSFLIAAYQYLLDWHLAWYSANDPESLAARKSPPVYQMKTGTWRLSTHERRRILLNNIFGVDIDPQAVEVTKLSLLLIVLHGETEETLSRQLGFFARALPDLGSNIKCGNSLIGPEFYAQTTLEHLSDDDKFRINVFDWKTEFSKILKAGGFDAVIGNPPYRRELDHKDLMDEIAATPFGSRFKSARMDLWYYFVHRGLELLKPNGVLSFIVNAYWLAGTGSDKLIAALRDDAHVEEIFFLSKMKVFRNVVGQHLIMRLGKGRSDEPTLIKMVTLPTEINAEPFVVGHEPVDSYKKLKSELFREGKIDIIRHDAGLMEKLGDHPPLAAFGEIRQGIAENPAAINKKTNDTYDKRWNVGEGVFVLTEKEVKRLNLSVGERSLLRPYHELQDLGRYYLGEPSRWLIYSTRRTCPDIRGFPILQAHLRRFKPIMEERRETKNGSNDWWHLHWPREERIWEASKVIALQMATRPSFVPATRPCYVSFSTNVFIPSPLVAESLYYFAGLLNSKLLWRWFEQNAKRRGVGLEINGNVLRRAPIRRINLDSDEDLKLHNRIVELVKRAIPLALQKVAASVSHDRVIAEREFQELDRRIDDCVYRLYGLSEANIREIDDYFEHAAGIRTVSAD